MSAASPLVIVLPGALPPPAMAGDLAAAVRGKGQVGASPALAALLAQGRADLTAFDVRHEGCTPHEGWWLTRAGFTPPPAAEPALARGAGLAPLFVDDAGDAPVWLARLAHIRISQDHLALSDPALLDVGDDESAALADAVRQVFADDGFTLERVSAQDWRVRPATAPAPAITGATPDAAVDRDIDAWWPQGNAARPWRRLVNEVQMVWHAHPVNAARQARGQADINTLWLFGGARPWRATLPASRIAGGPAWLAGLARAAGLPWSPLDAAAVAPGAMLCADSLERYLREEDWGRWLAELARLDGTLLAAARAALDRRAVDRIELILTGSDRIAQVSIAPPRGLARWLPVRNQDWTDWWSHPAS